MDVVLCLYTLTVQVVGLDIGCYFFLPLVSIQQQLLLVVEQLLMGLCGELKVGSLEAKHKKYAQYKYDNKNLDNIMVL